MGGGRMCLGIWLGKTSTLRDGKSHLNQKRSKKNWKRLKSLYCLLWFRNWPEKSLEQNKKNCCIATKKTPVEGREGKEGQRFFFHLWSLQKKKKLLSGKLRDERKRYSHGNWHQRLFIAVQRLFKVSTQEKRDRRLSKAKTCRGGGRWRAFGQAGQRPLPIGQRARTGSTNGGKGSWDMAPVRLNGIQPPNNSSGIANLQGPLSFFLKKNADYFRLVAPDPAPRGTHGNPPPPAPRVDGDPISDEKFFTSVESYHLVATALDPSYKKLRFVGSNEGFCVTRYSSSVKTLVSHA